MKVHWTKQALDDSKQIWDYLVERNPDAAIEMDELLEAAADRLAEFPFMGHEGEIVGTREVFPHQNYRLVHETQANTVWIVALVHTSLLWPRTIS